MAKPPEGMHFTYFPGPDRIVLTPIGKGAGLDEPLSRFLEGVNPADLAALRGLLRGNGDQSLTFRRPPDQSFTLFAQALSDAPSGQAITAGVILESGPVSASDSATDSASGTSFVQAANASPHTIFMLDFDSGQHFWSDAFQKRYGHRPIQGPDAVARWIELVHPDDLARVQAAHGAARTGGAHRWQGEYRLRRADGGYARVIDRAIFFRRADGTISRSISSLEDISADQDPGTRQPETLEDILGAILAHAGALEKDEALGPAQRALVAEIREAGQRGLRHLTGPG